MESLQNPSAQSLAFRFETSAALGADCNPVERSATASLRNLSKPAADSLLRACPAAAFRLTLELVRALAQEVGFSEAGVVALPYLKEARDAARFEEWLGGESRRDDALFEPQGRRRATAAGASGSSLPLGEVGDWGHPVFCAFGCSQFSRL
jgi:hypothetical protein